MFSRIVYTVGRFSFLFFLLSGGADRVLSDENETASGGDSQIELGAVVEATESPFAIQTESSSSSVSTAHLNLSEAFLPCAARTPVLCFGINGIPTCCPSNPNGLPSCCPRTANGCLCPDNSCPLDGLCCRVKEVSCKGANSKSYCCPRVVDGPDANNCCGSVNRCLCPEVKVCPDAAGTCCTKKRPVVCRGLDQKIFCCAKNRGRTNVCCRSSKKCTCIGTNACPVEPSGFCCSAGRPVLCTFSPSSGVRKLVCCPKAVDGSTNVCCINSCAVFAGICIGGRRLGQHNQLPEPITPTEIPQEPEFVLESDPVSESQGPDFDFADIQP